MSFISFLLDKHIISDNIYKILSENKNFYKNTTEILLTITNLTEYDILSLKAEYYDIHYIADELLLQSKIFVQYHMQPILLQYCAIPFDNVDQKLNVAISAPENIVAIDAIRNVTQNYNVTFYLARKEIIKLLLFNYYKPLHQDYINVILQDATFKNASDIHVVPYENFAIIKYRIDGDLLLEQIITPNEYSEFCIAIKVASNLDISNARQPQSGHYQANEIDYRISTQPTIFGEKINIRILNKNKNFITIDNIGFSKKHTIYLKELTKLKYGMIIFCGPTGSGKTTSIYSLLSIINKSERNIMTLEDPVEYKMPGICQTEIKAEIFNFSTGIKSLLRQDPDVIFIGEIRDSDTAKMAIRAAMTGHLVLTTLHANDTFSAIQRLVDLDIPRYLIADNVISIISQRLVKAKRCGRTLIAEILQITEEIKTLIIQNATNQQLLLAAQKQSTFATLQQDYIEKLQNNTIEQTDHY